MNHCVISGHLGSDPAVFYSSDGVPVTTFSLAFRAGKDKTGWVKVVCFNGLAETAGKCLHHGSERVGDQRVEEDQPAATGSVH
jgi:single-strand DNA-binding protein